MACLPLRIDYGFLKHGNFVLSHVCISVGQHGSTKGFVVWMTENSI